jgi:hypothetical protein
MQVVLASALVLLVNMCVAFNAPDTYIYFYIYIIYLFIYLLHPKFGRGSRRVTRNPDTLSSVFVSYLCISPLTRAGFTMSNNLFLSNLIGTPPPTQSHTRGFSNDVRVVSCVVSCVCGGVRLQGL